MNRPTNVVNSSGSIPRGSLRFRGLFGCGRSLGRDFRVEVRTSRGSKRLGALNARSFFDGVDGGRGKIAQDLSGAIRPANFDGVHAGVFAEPEVKAQVVLRKIAASAVDLAHLDQVTGGDRDPCADGGFIALGPDELKRDRVTWV